MPGVVKGRRGHAAGGEQVERLVVLQGQGIVDR